MTPDTERKADDSIDGYVEVEPTEVTTVDEIRNWLEAGSAVNMADADPVVWGYPTPTK